MTSWRIPFSCGLVLVLGAALLPMSAQRQDAGQTRPAVDDDGTVHLPAMAVPMSSYLSPEGKAYVTQFLKSQQRPRPVQTAKQDNGIPNAMDGRLERQKVLYPVDREDTKIAGVHAYIFTPKMGISAPNRTRVLINLHGGGFNSCWPRCAELESMPVTALGKIKVVSLDYREGPEYKFPAASED